LNDLLHKSQREVKCIILHPFNKDKNNSSITGAKRLTAQLRAAGIASINKSKLNPIRKPCKSRPRSSPQRSRYNPLFSLPNAYSCPRRNIRLAGIFLFYVLPIIKIPYSSTTPMRQVSSSNFFGKGKLDAIRLLVQDYEVNTLVVNARLSPLQTAGLQEFFPKVQVGGNSGMFVINKDCRPF
jgi:hypothetical protein